MVTETGYRRRTLEEIVEAKKAQARELFGEDINTEENTALGKYILINAYDQYVVEETAEQIYYSIFPQTATGQSLDRLGWLVGLSRNAATPAQYAVDVTGSAGTVIEYGFLVGTESEINFYNTEETVIGEDGTCTIIVECTEAGIIGNVAPNEINQVVEPSAVIETIIGTKIERAGEAEESDYDFYKRFEIVREGKGGCSEASLVSAIVNIPTVNGAYVIVNESATDTVDGIPPKTIACYVDGGENYHQEIGEAIFDKKPVGVGTHGDISVLVEYGALKDYAVKFSHAKDIEVYVSVELITDAEFESTGNEDIKSNVKTFIDSLGIGQTLVTTQLYKQLYSVVGVVSAVIKVSTDDETYTGDNIATEVYECCTFKQISINGEVV